MPKSRSADLPILTELGDELKAAFRAQEGTSGSDRRRLRFRPRGLPSRAVGLIAVGAALLVAVLATGIVHRGLAPASAAAVRALRHAASSAEHHAAPAPRDDQFLYTRSVATETIPIRRNPTTPLPRSDLTLPRATVVIETQTWSSADRVGRVRARLLRVQFPTPAARRLWQHLGSPPLVWIPQGGIRLSPLGSGRYLLGNIELTRAQLLHTTTNPGALYRRLYAAGGSPKQVFTEIGDALRGGVAPATLRAALYRALALVPRIRFDGAVTDRAGRTGTAIGFVQDGIEQQLIFDPKSSEMLAERSVIATQRNALGLGAGSVVSDSAYLRRAVTDTLATP